LLFSVNTDHMQFYLRITGLARCPSLYHAIEKEQILIFSWFHDRAAHRYIRPHRFHSMLAEALCSGDSQMIVLRPHDRAAVEARAISGKDSLVGAVVIHVQQKGSVSG